MSVFLVGGFGFWIFCINRWFFLNDFFFLMKKKIFVRLLRIEIKLEEVVFVLDIFDRLMLESNVKEIDFWIYVFFFCFL